MRPLTIVLPIRHVRNTAQGAHLYHVQPEHRRHHHAQKSLLTAATAAAITTTSSISRRSHLVQLGRVLVAVGGRDQEARPDVQRYRDAPEVALRTDAGDRADRRYHVEHATVRLVHLVGLEEHRADEAAEQRGQRQDGRHQAHLAEAGHHVHDHLDVGSPVCDYIILKWALMAR